MATQTRGQSISIEDADINIGFSQSIYGMGIKKILRKLKAACTHWGFKQDEVDRMQTVMKNFNLYKTIEMVLLVVGVCLIGFLQRFDVAAGIGAGLVLQAAFTLALDMFAEARGQDYLAALNGLVP